MSRQGVVANAASVPAPGAVRTAHAAESLKRFRVLSARLTGFPEDALDPALAGELMDRLQAAGDGAGLERLLSGTGGEDDLSRRIVTAWYSGIHPTPDGEIVATFGEALVWRVLDFTKPPGDCSAEPGDWAHPAIRKEKGP